MNVLLGIASYAGDMAVLDRVREAGGALSRGAIVGAGVVDSGDRMACEPLRRALADDFPEVEYLHHEENLGSAGNLAERLRWAMRAGADVLLAVNADGAILEENLRHMVAWLSQPRVAAVYPAYVIDGSRIDLAGRQRIPVLPSRAPMDRLRGREAIAVRWGSSNGAMYRLDALRAIDLDRIAALWYGWEDLGLGLGLDAAGNRQVLSVRASQPTAADQRRLAGTGMVVSDKPPWTTYYGVRNLVLLGRDHPRHWWRIVLRVLRELAVVLVRDRRRERYARALRGLADGLLGRTGQRVPPRG